MGTVGRGVLDDLGGSALVPEIPRRLGMTMPVMDDGMAEGRVSGSFAALRMTSLALGRRAAACEGLLLLLRAAEGRWHLRLH